MHVRNNKIRAAGKFPYLKMHIFKLFNDMIVKIQKRYEGIGVQDK